MPALGALLGAVPAGLLADRIGRKPLLLMSALLTPIFLAAIGLVSSPAAMLILAFLQGVVSTAYWVTNMPLLVENTTEQQRVGVLALNSFMILGIGSFGSLLGGTIPEFVGHLLNVSSASVPALRWGVIAAASFTFVFGIPLWFLHEKPRPKTITEPLPAIVPDLAPTTALAEATPIIPEQSAQAVKALAPALTEEAPIALASPAASAVSQPVRKQKAPVLLFVQLLLCDMLLTMAKGQ